jgi:deoxyhypusine synthase
MDSMMSTGFQATAFAEAVEEVKRMISWRLSDDPIKASEDDHFRDPEVRRNTKCTIFLAYTSNMISCGVREVVRFLAQHRMVDVITTSAGGIEEDLMKCIEPHYIGSFSLDGRALRLKGHNRIGNLIVPNVNYCAFEDWMNEVLGEMHDEQDAKGTNWTPSKMIKRFGERIENPESVYYWCAKNDIPVFCPAITDGSVGDMVFFHSYRRPGFRIDLVEDIREINDIALRAKKTGMLILGGGVVKHHTCNANLMRNGADFAVYINTGQEFDGSDSGARPDEAVSWGKIRLEAKPVKMYADASFVFPLLVGQTFARMCPRLSETTEEMAAWALDAPARDKARAERRAREDAVRAEEIALLEKQIAAASVTATTTTTTKKEE